jgi:CubicO group peptidase (beta-lactamase class C family)
MPTRNHSSLPRLLAVFLNGFCLLVVWTLTSATARGQQSESNQVDEYVKQRMRESPIPGLSLAVVKDGKVVKASGYGAANLETGTPAGPETEYRIASISKQFIATAILLLVQEGKIGVDDKAAKYLVGAPESWSQISIRQLLTHTSGIPRDPADYHPYREQPIAEVIQSTYELPLSFQPGEKWLYSNVGYYVLAEVISRASGVPWDAFISEHLFAPAQMSATQTGTAVGIVPHRASGYQWTNAGAANAENWIAVRPSSAFLSTVLDLAKWDVFLTSSGFLNDSSRKMIWSPAKLNDGAPVDYGFGWYVDSFLGRTRIHHDGQYPGFRSDYERFEQDKLSVMVLANSDRVNLGSMAIKIAGIYEPKLSAPPFALSADVPSGLATLGHSVEITVTATDQGNAAPDSLVEMEIWDESGVVVYKEHQAGQNFAERESKALRFSWTPARPGKYSVNVGAYGPKWVASYSWKENAASILVN